MITAEDIVEKQFSATFRGYNQEEVDEFLDDITETLKTLEKENQSFKRQVKRLKEDQRDL
ncbi:DivIVA domain-containing protein [Streptococcus mutans]|uniref:DivIVA domain-containing protein n=1 Tax=Streptococcus mutans TaxID=1309 RepID=UPI0002D6E800|nr:DivIVA domain-containing protein [Streptococcus mutans]